MRVLRRRVAAMSPREKHLAIISALGVVGFALYYIPTFLYATLILAVCCIACYYHSGEPLPARLGLNPRTGFNVPVVLRRWLRGWGVTGVSAATQGRTKSSRNKTELRNSEGHSRERFGETGIYRRETLESDSFIFSPRDFLMGSYIGKPESPTADSGRPRAGRNPREQLREKLSRPNHAVYTPNRRLSFAGEPVGAMGRFTITPQRHYPLQQPGVSSVGVLPPVKWDGFRKKNILSPRNSPAVLSPVTVKIARPDHHSTPSVDHLSCAVLPRAPVDPCSRESVLKVLKESRKREVEEEDRSFTAEQRSKRRRNDSGGSAHSAFGPLLPNGTPSLLVPKPGSLKRGMISLAEESIMKRSRTSSISSGSGVHAPRGTPGTTRNPIHSSYSSTSGISQWKKRSAPSPPLSSPGSSRSQTPEGASKRSREEDGQSPSSASSVRSDQAASEKSPVTSKLTPVPKVPVTASTHSNGSGGKRKRKIQLVSSHRDDQISLPLPPELGYTITVKDLDEEKKAAISKIQKVLETPAPEPEKSFSPSATASSQPPSSTSSTTLSSLVAAPLPTTSSSAIPVINLDPSPSTALAASNPLLDALKMKSSIPASSTSAANTTSVSASSHQLVQPSGLNLKASTTAAPQLPPSSQSQSSSSGLEQPSAFTQVLAQVSKAPSSTPPAAGPVLFGLPNKISTPTASSASTPVSAATPASSSGSVSNSNPLLASGFKPIFAVTPTTSSTTSTPESKPSVQNFNPIFGGPTAGAGFGQSASLTTTNPASTFSSSSTSSVFGSTNSTTVAPSVFPGLVNTTTGTTSTSSITATQTAAQPVVKSLFSNWSTSTTTSSSSAAAQAPNNGSTFQFGTAATTTAAAAAPAAAATTSGSGTIPFGAAQPDPQAANQKVFTFGQAAPNQNTTTASFGGFTMASAASTTAAVTTQSTFTFGNSSFQAPTAQSTFSPSTAQSGGQSTFGPSTAQSGGQSTFGPSTAQSGGQSTFGPSAVQSGGQSTFGPSAVQSGGQSTFGPSAVQSAAQSTFGPSAVQSAAQSTFGPSAVQSAAQSTFGPSAVQSGGKSSFGSSAAQSAMQSSFGSSAAPQSTFGPSAVQSGGKSTFGSSAAQSAMQSTFGSSAAPQSTFGSSAAPQSTFGSSAAPQSTFGSSAAPASKPFTFGSSGGSSAPSSNPTPPPFAFGSAAVTTATSFGTPAKPAFGASSTGFAFGGTTAPSAAPSAAPLAGPSFGASTQTQSSTSATFAFGGAPSGPAQSAPSGFNFGAAVPQFGTPVSNNPAPQMGSFNFGAAATDKPAFGTSTPSFGQSAAAGPIPFGSPGTPVQGFNAVPFGSPATPSFSIGAGSKPSGARQRLQARRQHNRKK